MADTLPIQFMAHADIDKSKWDACMDRADNGLIYGYSFYLDTMAGEWHALLFNDYEAVMPLTWHKKFGISYLHQPAFTAQLGIFGKNIDAALLNSFLHAIPPRYRYWDICLNAKNNFHLKDFPFYLRKNLVLDLRKSYEELFHAYNENTVRNIRKASQAGCVAQKEIDIDKVMELAMPQMKKNMKDAEMQARKFRKLYQLLHNSHQAVSYGVAAKDKLLAAAVYFLSYNRAYYILAGNHPDNKSAGASHFLMDAFIKEHAGKNLLLDFEGSDIPGLAFFYSGFGAREENYPAIRFNRLPFYLKWLKK
jgi:hypothetical protein